jgi:hypothetical protein
MVVTLLQDLGRTLIWKQLDQMQNNEATLLEQDLHTGGVLMQLPM